MQGRFLIPQDREAHGYEQVQIPKDKYLKIVHGRNIFIATFVTGLGMAWGMSLVPQCLMYRSTSWIYRKYCRGRVLDLTPKIADRRDVRYYEMSSAVRVEFIVGANVVSDDYYKLDESLSEEEQSERRKAMTLGFMVKNDHNWVGSPVTFAVVEKKETEMPGFGKYDTVVIRHELLNMSEGDARSMLNSASAYVSKEGLVILVDFGKPTWPLLASFARWFSSATGSSTRLTHDYKEWIVKDARYSVVAERRCLFGFHYAMTLRQGS
uniref:Uncharacterized protein n=1 Tax=Trypanosoma congolense (strain IL3000) TaxID=1068625 RepID=G0UX24_TRYCI|nr:conserved hypothetical protein [Trypanosoma congolense IL3000]